MPFSSADRGGLTRNARGRYHPIMAIRFYCTSCNRPIEIDDEWANRTVVCPFCRAAVTAPAESVPDMERAIPVAPQADPALAPPVAAPSSNLVAISAFVAVWLAIALFIMAGMVLAPHVDELAALTQAAESGSHQATMEAMQKLIERHGGPPPWLLRATVVFMGGVFAWLAALVCGLLGLRGRRRRGFAGAALVMVFAIPVFLCCGGGLPGG